MNKLKIIYFFLGVFVISSCSKFLDREPISIPTDVNFWKNEKDATAAIAGVYDLQRKSFNEAIAFYAYGDFASDEFIPNLSGEDWASVAGMNWSASIPTSSTYRSLMKLRRFDNFYKTINSANRCLKYIPQIPESEFTTSNPASVKNKLIGEAYFMRAFNYFYLSRVWGDVPLVLEAEEDITQAAPMPRIPQKEVLDQAIKDLRTAIPMLPWGYPIASDRAVRANRGAAYALLAHIYAWRGEYNDCAIAADSVLTKGGYSFVSRSSYNSYLSIFKGKSNEGIFEIAQSSDNESSGSGNRATAEFIAFKTLKSPYLLTITGNAVFTLEKSTVTSLFPDTTDLRVKNMFAFFNTTDPITLKYSNIKYTAFNSQGVGTSPLAQSNIIVFRYSDIVLLKAEAAAATGNFGEARTLLNSVRNQASAGATTATDDKLFETIIAERGRELFMEGHRFYDLIRLMRAKGINKFAPSNRMSDAEFQAGKYYWPIDPLLIQTNSTFVQTPFWRDKM